MSDRGNVVIVGAGTAGIPAALFAAGQGRRIVLIDAADKVGGSLHLSMGTTSAAGTRLQRAKGIDDTPALHLADSVRIAHGTSRLDLLELWQHNAADTLHWLLDLGLSFPPDQPADALGHDAYSRPRLYTPIGGGKAYLAILQRELDAAVARGAIELRLSTRMTDLILEDGAVTGVRVEDAAGAEVIAAEAVLLSAGGYGASSELWSELHGLPRRTHTYPFCRGDAFKIARERGLAVDYWQNYIPTVGGTSDPDAPEQYWIHTALAPAVRAPWEIMVNLRGERFMAEDIESPDFRERMLQAQPDLGTWVVYDEAIRRDAPPFFYWPPEKVERAFVSHPDYQRAETLAELAVLCGLDPEALARTVERYNQGRAAGSDAYLRKHMPAAIAEGPFYAVKHHPTAALTYGGIKTDGALRVLHADQTPVRGLYAAGEALGMGAFGNCHLGGVTISSSLTFGRLLGPVLAGNAREVRQRPTERGDAPELLPEQVA